MAKTVPTVDDLENIDAALSTYVTKNDTLVLLLDYDGTLAPLVAHPDLSETDPAAEEALRSLNALPNVHMAVISGRAAEDARGKLRIDNITFAGNHGLEIIFHDGSQYHYEVPEQTKENFVKMAAKLEAKLGGNGAWIENKQHSLTFHYRSVPPSEHDAYKVEARNIIESYGFIPNQAHMAIEAKPPVQWNKGEAALHILRKEFGKNWADKVRVIFAGDDTTDEDAMQALKGAGLSFRVSTNPDIQTHADFRVPSIETIAMILNWLLQTLSQK